MNPHPDSAARFAASCALVCCVVTLVLITACGCRDAETYIALTLLAVMAGFVAATQDA